MRAGAIDGSLCKNSSDPISLEEFDEMNENDVIRIPSSDHPGQFWCQKRNELNAWLKNRRTNPLTNKDFSDKEIKFIEKDLVQNLQKLQLEYLQDELMDISEELLELRESGSKDEQELLKMRFEYLQKQLETLESENINAQINSFDRFEGPISPFVKKKYLNFLEIYFEGRQISKIFQKDSRQLTIEAKEYYPEFVKMMTDYYEAKKNALRTGLLGSVGSGKLDAYHKIKEEAARTIVPRDQFVAIALATIDTAQPKESLGPFQMRSVVYRKFSIQI